MMQAILEHEQIRIINQVLVKAFNLKKYFLIINYYLVTDVSTNLEFQKAFIEYFKIKRSQEWRKAYFDYFETHKNNKKLSLSQILRYLYKRTRSIEPLHASQMLSIIKSTAPIWDITILMPRLPAADPFWKKMDKLEGFQKISEIDNLYDKMTVLTKEFLGSQKGKDYVNLFNTLVYEYSNISNTKKIELLGWKAVENVISKWQNNALYP